MDENVIDRFVIRNDDIIVDNKKKKNLTVNPYRSAVERRSPFLLHSGCNLQAAVQVECILNMHRSAHLIHNLYNS
jgi:hypothetical protein